MSDKKTAAVELTGEELDDIVDALRSVSDAYHDDGDDELVSVAVHIDDVILPKLRLAREALS